MTPLELDILLHYYCRANDYRDGDFSAPAVRSAIDTFREDPAKSHYEAAGLLVESEYVGQTYTLSERGRVWIEHLLSRPLPVQVWVIPRPSPNTEQSSSANTMMDQGEGA